MAWSTPKTDFSPGNILTAAQMNAIGNNLIAGGAAMCRVVLTSDDNPYTADTAISWDSATANGGYDTASMWSAGDPTKITIPTAGIYLVSLRGYITCTATLTACTAYVVKNGTPSTSTALNTSGAHSTTSSFATMTSVMKFAAADYIKAAFSPIGGSAYVLNGQTSEAFDQTCLMVTWLGTA
jgi:hypothetical protein